MLKFILLIIGSGNPNLSRDASDGKLPPTRRHRICALFGGRGLRNGGACPARVRQRVRFAVQIRNLLANFPGQKVISVVLYSESISLKAPKASSPPVFSSDKHPQLAQFLCNLTPLFATLTDPLGSVATKGLTAHFQKAKSFVCHTCEKQGGTPSTSFSHLSLSHFPSPRSAHAL
jgi:hypothetical protein